MKKVFILGAGTMGAGIAQTFASHGYEVILRDLNDQLVNQGLSTIQTNLTRLVTKEKISEAQKEDILSRLTGTTDLNFAEDCDLVLEAIAENMEIKKLVFRELDNICNAETIFATNTSSLSVTEIAASTRRPDKVIGMHFFNPAPVMRLIEVIRALSTSQETFEAISTYASSLEKEPVEIQEAPGFVVNRILIPMINEAICILSEGIASASDIDKAMILGANHPIGPLALADLIGLDVCLNIMDVLYDETKDSKYRAHPLLKKYVRGGLLGRKTKEGFFTYQ